MAALAVCAITVGSLMWAWQSLRDRVNPPGPNVSALATSAPVVAADQNAAAQVETELTRVRHLLPWIRPVTQGVQDTCAAQEIDATSIGSWPTWTPVQCLRTVVWFGSFNGPLPAALNRLDATMERAGMQPDGTAINQLLTSDHTQTPALNFAFGDYRDQNWTVDLTVDAPPDLRQALLSNPDLLISTSPLSAPPSTFTRTYRPVQTSELTAKVTPPDYVVGVRLRLGYYQQSPTAAASP
ncbi:hypothetical protein SAMN05414137_109163 [Streptacidiphilus jiangxiensis]|uniref:Uncharacterized protein n=1 Tax=Streptacidiphilus jiangxiensis TaxID=235985 RepID=A0A1H7QRC4_STRJI|nr:hypothetical protein SAMN05414137_109163 [Streptacidiphilus jiangxiensis]